MKTATATAPKPILSGFCQGTGFHGKCRGFYPGLDGYREWSCSCSCHLPEPEPTPERAVGPSRRRITPAAFLVSSAEPGGAEWLVARRPLITATAIPQILGLSKYGNARTVYERALGNLPEEDAGEAARWGNLLEDVVAREWALREGKTVRRVGVVANIDRPWMGASCDRRVDGEPAALEVKTRSAFVAGQWREDIPDDVLAQVAWQRIVTGFDRIYVACLIGGQRLLSFTYEPDEPVERHILERALIAHEQIEQRTPPVVDADQMLLDLLNRLYPDRSGDRDLTDKADVVANEIRLLELNRDARLVAEKGEVEAKARLVELLGDGQVALVDGHFAYAYPQRTRHTKAREASVSTYRQLVFTQPKESAA